MVTIPDNFFKIPYSSKQYPGKKGTINILKGVNCQLFVYELLRLNGFDISFAFRSSDLWKDVQYTEKVDALKPFDIVFFNKSFNPFGAHLGVFIGKNMVIHLSKVIGHPVIWNMDNFKKYDNYKFFLGAKRLKRISKTRTE